jgi:hypothetical protein
MKVPGFTAEASLYSQNRGYRSITDGVPVLPGAAVRPSVAPPNIILHPWLDACLLRCFNAYWKCALPCDRLDKLCIGRCWPPLISCEDACYQVQPAPFSGR